MFATVLVVLVLGDYVAGGKMPVNDLVTDVGHDIYRLLSSLEVNLIQKQQKMLPSSGRYRIFEKRTNNLEMRLIFDVTRTWKCS